MNELTVGKGKRRPKLTTDEDGRVRAVEGRGVVDRRVALDEIVVLEFMRRAPFILRAEEGNWGANVGGKKR